jgi:putative two-component system response regulator
MNTDKILFLDDDQNVLNALRRLFVRDFDILMSTSGPDALDLLRKNEVSVIVSDNLMPGMKGIEFLQQAKHIAPDSVRIMLTGYGDMQAAIDAINRGEVYKFIEKPWDNDELRATIVGSVDRYRVVRSLRMADEYSLYSIAQTIELKDHYTRGHCDRVARYAVAMAEAMGIDEMLKENIRRGSWLHDGGKIGVPEAILNYPGPLNEEQMTVVKQHPGWGADVIKLAHLPEPIVNIALYHHEHFDGSGYPFGLRGDVIPIEARIVNVADIFDALTSERPYRQGLSQPQALEILAKNKCSYSDPDIVELFVGVLGRINGSDLQTGVIEHAPKTGLICRPGLELPCGP